MGSRSRFSAWSRKRSRDHGEQRVCSLRLFPSSTDGTSLSCRIKGTIEMRFFVSQPAAYRLLVAHNLITSHAYLMVKKADCFYTQRPRLDKMSQTDFYPFRKHRPGLARQCRLPPAGQPPMLPDHRDLLSGSGVRRFPFCSRAIIFGNISLNGILPSDPAERCQNIPIDKARRWGRKSKLADIFS